MSIRPYSPDDLGKVVRVFRSNSPKYFAQEEENGQPIFLQSTPARAFYEKFELHRVRWFRARRRYLRAAAAY